MAKRRGHGEGSIYQRSRDGKWCAVIDLGRGPDGKRRRRTVTADTRQGAARKLRELQRDIEDGTVAIGRNMTLVAWLDRWLSDFIDRRVALGDLRDSTAYSYRQHVRDHLVPHIGAVKLSDLKPTHVRHLHSELLDKDLSPSTVARVHATLRKALTDAERDDLVLVNIAKKVSAPSGEKREPLHLPRDKVHALVEHEPDDPWHIAFVLMLGCGLRVGETLALRWSDVDLETGALTVRRKVRRHKSKLVFGEPKSARSRRTLVMPAIVVEHLRQHRAAQREQRIVAPTWKDEDLVITTTVGTVVDQRNLWRRWETIREELDIDPDTRLHDLRHSAGSLALLAGIPLRAVADLLGHSQTSVTADTYSHVLDEMKRETASRLDRVLKQADVGTAAEIGTP